jgi:hypothetical protein
MVTTTTSTQTLGTTRSTTTLGTRRTPILKMTHRATSDAVVAVAVGMERRRGGRSLGELRGSVVSKGDASGR